MSVRQAIWGEKREAIEASLREVDEDLFRYIRDFAYEEVLARPGLDLKTRELLAITALIALGSPKELATHLEGALRVGAREEEVREAILQSALFLGFPRALAAMKLFHQVLKGRGAPHPGER
ncbi:Gamma-carboxymuconolactone decarboxylase [Thermus sp. CCB_US3_UF1]|uniref:carboxymuconolactone decarboxylase family protein n=1 Tax=unclassified Thermus TaxID=2619321 RepID=UPI000238A028|nr:MULTISPECIES: carboxymuconolactone decarboxylase family protein [unclassified Thermus]AEV15581.1 Gamma-carboxymuconolactone decarboxylase [Thermus sp. CCB_US3_UF1]MDW8356976.1 carboxymuconolactone decarboxylase family protein [Thermus sp.]